MRAEAVGPAGRSSTVVLDEYRTILNEDSCATPPRRPLEFVLDEYETVLIEDNAGDLPGPGGAIPVASEAASTDSVA